MLVPDVYIYICVFFFCSLPLERDPFASILIDRINSSTRLPLILVKRLSFQRPLHENNHFGGGGGGRIEFEPTSRLIKEQE